MLTQIIVSIFVMIMLIRLIADARKGKLSLSKFLFWAFVWLALEAIVLFSGIVLFLSNLIGVERPKDLPIYVSIIILFFLILKIVMKMENIEREITGIVKKIALKKV